MIRETFGQSNAILQAYATVLGQPRCARAPRQNTPGRSQPDPSLREHRDYRGCKACAFYGLLVWLEAGSGKVVLSRPGRTPGWCPIPPTSLHQGATQYLEGAYPTREDRSWGR
jgi:hypothetical protein